MDLDERLVRQGVAISTRIMYNHTVNHQISTRTMYDDYDIDYTYGNDRSYDLDEEYDMWVQSYALALDDVQDDDDYARDTDTYETLAYRHYA